MSKYFRVEQGLVVGAIVALDPHRFGSVLRVQVGDALVLCDASGVLFAATVIGPLSAEIIGLAEAPNRNPRGVLEVWLPLLKGGRSDDLVRQLTELGATRIVPFSSKHSVVQLDGKKALERRDRFATIAREACNQCGRTDVPEIALPATTMPSEGPGAFLYEVDGAPAMPTLVAHPEITRVLSGPEGGIAATEASALMALGWRPLSLGARILRAETAVIVLATLAQAARQEI